MNTVEFLRLVLPASGWYCAHIVTGRNIIQTFHRSHGELASVLSGYNGAVSAIYFGVSSFSTPESRKQVNVHAVRSLALDVDCGEGKPYADWREGVTALGAFLRATGLPQPTIVLSGNGLHLYWAMNRDLPREEWFDLASRLRSACQTHDFRIDMSKTTDASMILRPVGTLSNKTGTEVRIGNPGSQHDPHSLGDRLSKYRASLFRKPTNARVSGLLKALGTTPQSPPAQAGLISRKCAQVNRMVLNQAGQSEPEWYALLGLAAHCEDSDNVAVAWSQGHPDFRQDRTLAKMEQWRASTDGPPTCQMLNNMNPGVCNGCIHLGKITSPIQVGAVRPEAAAPTVQVDRQNTVSAIQLPKPYKRTADGIFRNVDGVDLMVCPFDIMPVTFGMSEAHGYEIAHFKWDRPHVGWQDLQLRHSALAEGDQSFTTSIGDQGIMLSGRKQTGEFQNMLREYKNALEQVQAMDRSHTSFGWKDNGSFVIGGSTIRKGRMGVEVAPSRLASTLEVGMNVSHWTPKGSLSEWTRLTDLVDPDLYAPHLFALLVSLSAPLYRFALVHGVTISFYGPSGGGKSLAQYWAQSVWGNPDELHTKAQFTANALFAKLAAYGNLPLTIDEFTMARADEVGEFLYWVSQGRNKERLSRGGLPTPTLSWAAPVILSTNISILSKLDASLASDAQFMRLMELPIYPTEDFTSSSTFGKNMFSHMMRNHGAAGQAMLSHLVGLGADGIDTALATHAKEFDRDWEGAFTGEERYWETTVRLADCAGRIAKELGLVNFSVDQVIMSVMETIGKYRKAVDTRSADVFDHITAFVNSNLDALIRVRHNDDDGSFNVKANEYMRKVLMRIDTYRKNPEASVTRGYLHLDRAAFRRWLSERGVDYGTMMGELKTYKLLPDHMPKRISMGKGTEIHAGQVWVASIDLGHPRLYDMMHDAGQSPPFLREVQSSG